MAASPLKAFVVAALLFAVAGMHAAEKPEREQAIDFKSDGGYKVDFRTGKTVMHNVSVKQGNTSITAKLAEATGLDFKDSRWVFSGDVHIEAERRGHLHSDRAEVEFRDNRIARATITGSPAEFEQRTAGSSRAARGHAGEIVYNVGPGTVRLSKGAWLTYGRYEITGSEFTYNIRLEQVQSSTSASENDRVHITIVPKADSQESRPPATPPSS